MGNDLTSVLSAASTGDRAAAAELLPVVYDELRSMAGRMLRRERAGHTLQPTALAHEAYLKLIDQSRVEWTGRVHLGGGPAVRTHRPVPVASRVSVGRARYAAV